MIRIAVQQGTSDAPFDEIRQEWQLLYRSVDCSPFLSWEWMSAWFDHFGDGQTAFIIRVYRDDKVVGLLPMLLSTDSLLGKTNGRLSLMGESVGGADHLDLICDPTDYDEVFSAIIRFLVDRETFGLIRLESLSGTSRSIDLLRNIALSEESARTRLKMTRAAVCPQIDLAPGWSTVLNSGKRASNFKRRLKKLEQRSDFIFRSITAPGETGAAFERFLKLHQRRWERSGGSELTGHPKLIAFQRDIVERMSVAGLVRFDELWLDGDCRSSIYGLDDGRTFFYYNSGYDLDYSDLSVGLVLIGLSIKSAVERGNVLYDFLRGDETYKFDWANQIAEIVNVTLGRDSFSLAAADSLSGLMAIVKGIGKAALPKRMAASIASRRRAWKRNYQM